MTNETQEQSNGLTLENLVRSIPGRIKATRERINLEQKEKEKASKVWAVREENYRAISLKLGVDTSKFLKDYVTKLWPTIKKFLERNEERVFDVNALERRFCHEKPYLSFVTNGDKPIIWYYSGFRSGTTNYKPKKIFLGSLKEDYKKMSDLGVSLLSERNFNGNAFYSNWEKRVNNVPELPSELIVQGLYEEFTNCVLSSTNEALDKLIVRSFRQSI